MATIKLQPSGKVVLKARADRVDRLGDGTLAVLDYKTGTLPKPADLMDGSAPQLPLEAAMARRGAFEDVPAAPVRILTYWKLSGGETPGEVRAMLAQACSASETDSAERDHGATGSDG